MFEPTPKKKSTRAKSSDEATPKKTPKKQLATAKPQVRSTATGATRIKKVAMSAAPVKNHKPVIVAIVILSLLLISIAFSAYWSLWRTLSLPSAGYKLHIERGTNYSQVLAKMGEDGLVANLWLAKLYLKLSQAKTLQTGSYLFKEPISLAQLLSQLAKGEGLMTLKLTVIEGMTFKQLLAQLAARHDVKQTLTNQNQQQILQNLAMDVAHPEGLFAPDTYVFPLDESDSKILKRLYQQQQKILQQAWQTRADNLPYKNPYEALIMASIVEKETGAAAERPQIAGVFVKRLQLGMRLQTDPTVIYGMGDSYNGNIRKSDLLTYTPYNTYKINGLPPTPIALPSKAAIYAALNPVVNDNVYFVAKGDGSGTHTFSATLAQHNQAVAAYLQARRGIK